MWFRMAKGAESIQVQLQNFTVEVPDPRYGHIDPGECRHFFRAPDHFAPTILSIPGFTVETPEDIDESGLPPLAGQRDSAMEQMAAELQAARDELRSAREEVATVQAALTAMTANRDEIKLVGANAAGLYEEVKDKYEALRLALTDKGVDPDTLAPVANTTDTTKPDDKKTK